MREVCKGSVDSLQKCYLCIPNTIHFRFITLNLMMKKRKQITRYLVSDFLSAMLSWSLFFVFRKLYIEPLKFGYHIPVQFNSTFFLGLTIIPFFWLLNYYLAGYYRDVLRKSRLNDILQTFIQTFIGTVILFFLLLLDDEISSYKNYYLLFTALFSLHFIITLIPRSIILSTITRKIRNRSIYFPTIMIGSNMQAVDVYKEMEQESSFYGNRIIGFINVHTKKHYQLSDYLPHLGGVEDLRSILDKFGIEEVIIALERSEHSEFSKILNKLGLCDVVIKAIPDMDDILTGKVKTNQLFGTPLIQISHDLMPVWQANIKQLLDYFVAALALIIASPLILFLAAGVRLSSPGPLLYSHERIGRFGKPFRIYKFRSMYTDAEQNGPELSSRIDNRLTNFGRFMRKYRLDEIPNFYNVLRGDMSLVGPRPERKYFIDQIIRKAPHYVHLHKVKPGITSWGQVKYGYAENVEQMIKRLRYDILYIENMSLFVDLKILLYTILTIFRGRGV